MRIPNRNPELLILLETERPDLPTLHCAGLSRHARGNEAEIHNGHRPTVEHFANDRAAISRGHSGRRVLKAGRQNLSQLNNRITDIFELKYFQAMLQQPDSGIKSWLVVENRPMDYPAATRSLHNLSVNSCR